MAIGKSLRFQIFARDGFTCQYCGQQPPAVVLEVDHIHPVSRGGEDHEDNLVTACFDCNRGKRARIITEVAPRPDANLQRLKMQQEIAEAQAYLHDKAERDQVYEEMISLLMDMWQKKIYRRPPPETTFLVWLEKYGASEIEYAIIKCAIKRKNAHDMNAEAMAKYASAVMRMRAEENGGPR